MYCVRHEEFIKFKSKLFLLEAMSHVACEHHSA